MTQCIFKPKKFELECTGHASGEGESGKMCAALTALVLTLAFDINELSDFFDDKEVKIEPGYTKIRASPKEEFKEQTGFLMTAFVNGIHMLSQDPAFKERITLSIIEEVEGDT